MILDLIGSKWSFFWACDCRTEKLEVVGEVDSRKFFFTCTGSTWIFTYIYIYMTIPVMRFLAQGEITNWFPCGNVGGYLLQCILTRNQNTKVRHVLLPLFADSYLQNVLIVFYLLLCYYLLCVLWRFNTFKDVRRWCAVVKKNTYQWQTGTSRIPFASSYGGRHLFSP